MTPTELSAPRLDVGLKAAPVGIGDMFVFDNPPEQWTVNSIEGPFVSWQGVNGDYMLTAWSTLLPPLRWGGGDSATDVGRRRLTRLEGAFFPLQKGNRVAFVEERLSGRPGELFIGRWECTVGDRSEIVVPAGKADVWDVLCLLDGREKVLMSYSEKIGHFVRYVLATDGAPIIRQLTAYARGSAAAPAKDQAATGR